MTLAFPVIAAATTQGTSLADYVIWQGAVTFVLFVTALGIGFYARLHGSISLIDPMQLYDQLHKTKQAFKKDVTYFAGQHFQDNAVLIKDKSTYADMVTISFGLELVFGTWWLLGI